MDSLKRYLNISKIVLIAYFSPFYAISVAKTSSLFFQRVTNIQNVTCFLACHIIMIVTWFKEGVIIFEEVFNSTCWSHRPDIIHPCHAGNNLQ